LPPPFTYRGKLEIVNAMDEMKPATHDFFDWAARRLLRIALAWLGWMVVGAQSDQCLGKASPQNDGKSRVGMTHSEQIWYDAEHVKGRLSEYCAKTDGNFLRIIEIPLTRFSFSFAPVMGRHRTEFIVNVHCGVAHDERAFDHLVKSQTARTDGTFFVFNLGGVLDNKLYKPTDGSWFFICDADWNNRNATRGCGENIPLALGARHGDADRHTDLILNFGAMFDDRMHFLEISEVASEVAKRSLE
jgi:hypothetical protein